MLYNNQSARIDTLYKWERIIAGKKVDYAKNDCALCKKYFRYACYGCPVFIDTGKRHCLGTPYDAWVEHQRTEHKVQHAPFKTLCYDCIILAQNVYFYLEKIL